MLVFGGGLIAVIGGGMEGPLQPTSGDGLLTTKGLCVWLGGGLIFVGSVLLLILSDEAPGLLQRARELEVAAQSFLDERDLLYGRLAASEDLDGRRLALIDAGQAMLEASENALIAPGLAVEDAIEMALRAGQRMLVNAIDFGRDEYWAVSVFRVEGDELRRIVALRPNPLEERAEGRTWRRGQGFVGMAWLRSSEIIIADCNSPEVAAAYVVPEDRRMPTDPERYRSIAVVPVRVGLDDEFWGAVAISSNCVGRFKLNPEKEEVKNVETVRLIARTIELLAAGFARGHAG
jgi:hypothetical protein